MAQGYAVRYDADAGSIYDATRDLDRAWSEVQSIARSLEFTGRRQMREIFQQGLSDANAFGGFPEQFQDHVLSRLDNNVKFINSSSSYLLSVEFDFTDLGDWDDLPIAFHQGARLDNGETLWGAYTGQSLKQEDPSVRYVYWYGLDSDMWQATIEQRVNLWESIRKAPEWLYAEFGQDDWEPIIPPTAMLDIFQEEFINTASAMLHSYVRAAINITNSYASTGVSAKPVYRLGKLTQSRLTSGVNAGFGPSGKPRQAGQYYFKN